MTYRFPAGLLIAVMLISCAPGGRVKKHASRLLRNPALENAHVGISVSHADRNRTLFGYQSSRYFVPASNVKIFTLYAGLKYLGDSLVGMRCLQRNDTLFVFPSADPTLLHRDFTHQPVVGKLRESGQQVALVSGAWQDQPFGSGWSWDDYNSGYMAEKSALPVYGNLVRWMQSSQQNQPAGLEETSDAFVYSEPEVNWKVQFVEDTSNHTFHVERNRHDNIFRIYQGKGVSDTQAVPFVTNPADVAALLEDTIGKPVTWVDEADHAPLLSKSKTVIRSQPTDALLRLMMHRSDNFFAEQVLLMAALEHLGKMNTTSIIDTLLSGTFRQLPQQPRWVDGSGLSRYNLFSPDDIVWVLRQLKDEFGEERVKTLFVTGDEGTLQGYYVRDSGYVYAKTGTLSGTVALSGYLYTHRNRRLIFSVLVNNHQGNTTDIRRAVESFVSGLRNRY